MSPQIRLMLVDDHEVVRLGLRALFRQTETIEVVAEAGSVAEAVKGAALHRPDVVLDGSQAAGRHRNRCVPRHPVRQSRHTGSVSDVAFGRRGGRVHDSGGSCRLSAEGSRLQGAHQCDRAGAWRPVDTRSEGDEGRAAPDVAAGREGGGSEASERERTVAAGAARSSRWSSKAGPTRKLPRRLVSATRRSRII